jgi:hypothetical protein
MDEPTSRNIVLELSPDEAARVAAALRQFEPYWPADASDLSRAELLSGIRDAIADVSRRLVR